MKHRTSLITILLTIVVVVCILSLRLYAQPEVTENRVVRKSTCLGSVDSIGFPVASISELAQLKAVILSQGNLSSMPSFATQAEILKFVRQLPLSAQIRELQIKALNLDWRQRQTNNPEKLKDLSQELIAVMKQLNADPCYVEFRQAFINKLVRETKILQEGRSDL